MKPCEICGTAHESYQAHVFRTVGVVDFTKPSVANKSSVWLTPVANAKKPAYRYRDPEKRREYMREYMRKRRAK